MGLFKILISFGIDDLIRITEHIDIEAKYQQVDRLIKQWAKDAAGIADVLHDELRARLRISLIHHDAALEGEVLSYSEISAAMDPLIVKEAAANPTYQLVKRYYDASKYADRVAREEPLTPIRMEIIRKVHSLLAPELGSGTASYRKENPLHRLYYHDIVPPEKIGYQMRKFGEWLDLQEQTEVHPVARAANTHYKLMTIFPWNKESGRCARIVSNLILFRANYPMAIIHSIDRQKYFEALKAETSEELEVVYLEAVETTAKSSLQVFDEAREQGLVKAVSEQRDVSSEEDDDFFLADDTET